MSAEADPEEESAPKKKGMLIPLVAGLVLALVGGGGGFWAVTSGPLASMFGGGTEMAEDGYGEDGSEGDGYGDAGDGYEEEGDGYGGSVDVAFVPLETLTISLGPNNSSRHLIFAAQLEVAPEYTDEVTTVAPRILDVLNSYLRVVSLEELNNPTSLSRLRAQMLHRIQIVTGDGRVRDLLITQFVVN